MDNNDKEAITDGIPQASKLGVNPGISCHGLKWVDLRASRIRKGGDRSTHI
jgi:hypothetical protein